MEFFQYLGAFLSYMIGGIVSVVLFGFIYSKVTPHNELALIKENNTSASLAFGGAMLGYMIAVSGVIKNAVSIGDFAAWAVVALAVQIAVYFLVRLAFPKISERIEDKDDMAAAVFLAIISVGAGMLNAACMTY